MDRVSPRGLGLSLKPAFSFRVYSLRAPLSGRPLALGGTWWRRPDCGSGLGGGQSVLERLRPCRRQGAMKCVFQAKRREQMAHAGDGKRMSWLPVLVVSAASPCEHLQWPRRRLRQERLYLPCCQRRPVPWPLPRRSTQPCNGIDAASSPSPALPRVQSTEQHPGQIGLLGGSLSRVPWIERSLNASLCCNIHNPAAVGEHHACGSPR